MDLQPRAIPLASSLIKPAAAVLTRAFSEDPFITYVLPQTVQRDRIIGWLFERLLMYGQTYGKVFTTPALEGVAMWLGPDRTDLEWMGIIQSGLFWLPFQMGWEAFRRSMALTQTANRMHHKLITGPHWYLYELGVDPSHRREGVGSALLQPILTRADRERLACYLETNNEVNLPFYERNGFRLADRGQAATDSPFTWSMLRKPGA